MKRAARLVGFGLSVLFGPFATGCYPERDVQMSMVTTSLDGQSVTRDRIELVEGQAIGIRVHAVKNDKVKDDWSIHATSMNPSIAEVRRTTKEHVFVVTGSRAGQTEIGFEARDRAVYVDVIVEARPEWEPTADEFAFGGAGGFGGFGGGN